MKKNFLKDIMFFTFLILMSLLGVIFRINMVHESWNDKIIDNFFLVIHIFLCFGLFLFLAFKIERGESFIYCHPKKGKNFFNIDLGESIMPGRFQTYSAEILFLGGRTTMKRKIFLAFLPFISLIFFIISYFNSSLFQHKLFVSIVTIFFIPFFMYALSSWLSPLWLLYVKLFKFLNLNCFVFFERDINKTINSHRCFPISVVYYNNLQQKKAKL